MAWEAIRSLQKQGCSKGQGEALAKLLWLHRRGACRQHSFCLDALSTLFC